MADQVTVKPNAVVRQGRGPAYPWISLEKAVERVNQIREANIARASVSPLSYYKVWKYKGDSGPARQTLAALNQFGLTDYVGKGDDRKVMLSPLALRILFDKVPNSTERAEALKEAALKPSIYSKLRVKLGIPLPPDFVIETFLVRDCEYSEEASKNVLSGYKGTLAFAGLAEPANIPDQKSGEQGGAALKKPAKIGDYVQWTSNGSDQFKRPLKVTWVADDGSHLRVHGSMTGIPMAEVAVVEAPKLLQDQKESTRSGEADSAPDISVLLVGKRLEITASVDAAGLAKLKDVLGKYEEILKLMQ